MHHKAHGARFNAAVIFMIQVHHWLHSGIKADGHKAGGVPVSVFRGAGFAKLSCQEFPVAQLCFLPSSHLSLS